MQKMKKIVFVFHKVWMRVVFWSMILKLTYVLNVYLEYCIYLAVFWILNSDNNISGKQPFISNIFILKINAFHINQSNTSTSVANYKDFAAEIQVFGFFFNFPQKIFPQKTFSQVLFPKNREKEMKNRKKMFG